MWFVSADVYAHADIFRLYPTKLFLYDGCCTASVLLISEGIGYFIIVCNFYLSFGIVNRMLEISICLKTKSGKTSTTAIPNALIARLFIIEFPVFDCLTYKGFDSIFLLLRETTSILIWPVSIVFECFLRNTPNFSLGEICCMRRDGTMGCIYICQLYEYDNHF